MKIKLKGGKMEKRYILGIAALAMIAFLGVSFVSAFGFKGGLSDEDRETLEDAMESGDYEAWASIKNAQISEERFEEARARQAQRQEFREAMQKARESGDFSKAQELREEYGIKKRGMSGGNCNKEMSGSRFRECGNCRLAE